MDMEDKGFLQRIENVKKMSPEDLKWECIDLMCRVQALRVAIKTNLTEDIQVMLDSKAQENMVKDLFHKGNRDPHDR